MTTFVNAKVGAMLELYDLTPRAVARLTRDLSLPNPIVVQARRMNRTPPPDEPRVLDCVGEFPDGSIHVPRGAADVVRVSLAEDDMAFRVIEDRRAYGKPLTAQNGTPADVLYKTFLERFQLREYQERGVEEIRKHVQGTIVLPCQTGKSFLAVTAILAIGRTALIIVPSNDIAEQWFRDLISVGANAGIVGGGKDERKQPVVVGVIDSVANILKSDPKWGERFGVVIVDEAHRTPCRKIMRVLQSLPARWRVGMTATPTREDGLVHFMDWSFGQRLLERTTAEMIEAGFLMSTAIDAIKTGWTFSYSGPKTKRLSTMHEQLATDMLRNAVIADHVVEDVKAGETVLVLAGRKNMVKELAEMIQLRGVACIGLTSLSGKRIRRSALENLKSGELRCVIATQLADEGLSIPRLSRVHLAFPQRAKGPTTQRLGRLLGKYDKVPKLIDYEDNEVDTLARRAEARRRVYRELKLQ